MPDYDVPYRRPGLVRQLKDAFENLGRAIGPYNDSVWLTTEESKDDPEDKEHPESFYDYERAQDILLKLGLDTATGPYIVITLTSPNFRLSPGTQAFVARLTGVKYECYPQIVDNLTKYITKERPTSSWRWAYDSVEKIRIDMARTVCGSSIDVFNTGK